MPQRPAPLGRPRRDRGTRLGRRLQDEARFLRSWLDHPLTAGAIAPSGPALARAMAAAVDPQSVGPVIELGPGTGPVTEALIERGVAEERLILVEFDPNFCALLAARFPRARIVNGDAYGLSRTLREILLTPAAAIVSSLPLLTRPERDRVRLLEQAFGLLAQGAPFIQFTYGLGSPVPRSLKGLDAQVLPPVWLNIPPARVWVYRPARAAVLPLRRRDPDLLDRLRDEWRETTGKVRDEWRERTEKVRADRRIRPTLDLIRRIADHMDGPDTHVAADEALRGRWDPPPPRP